MPPRRAPVLIVAVTLLAPGLLSCAGGDGNGPEGAEPLIRVTLEGGFAPIDNFLHTGPAYTLTAEGTLVFQGPVLAIFPGPLVSSYQTVEVTRGEMRQIERLAERIGLPAMVDEVDDSLTDRVADGHTTVITYWDESGTHRYSVYALGLAEGNQPEPTRLLAELLDVFDHISFSRVASPYQPEGVQIIATPGVAHPDFVDKRPWPLPGERPFTWDGVAGRARCRVFGPEALEPFGDATQATTWASPDPQWAEEITLLIRQLHPGEQGC